MPETPHLAHFNMKEHHLYLKGLQGMLVILSGLKSFVFKFRYPQQSAWRTQYFHYMEQKGSF